MANQSFLFQQKSLLSAAIMFPETTEKKNVYTSSVLPFAGGEIPDLKHFWKLFQHHLTERTIDLSIGVDEAHC